MVVLAVKIFLSFFQASFGVRTSTATERELVLRGKEDVEHSRERERERERMMMTSIYYVKRVYKDDYEA